MLVRRKSDGVIFDVDVEVFEKELKNDFEVVKDGEEMQRKEEIEEPISLENMIAKHEKRGKK
ncbi:MAG: hypothetical protein QXW35_03575 [Candidatus Aenigmatarchaeota archaeon]